MRANNHFRIPQDIRNERETVTGLAAPATTIPSSIVRINKTDNFSPVWLLERHQPSKNVK